MKPKKIIEDYYDAFNRKDYPAMLALLTDDVIHDINQGSRDVGKANFKEFLKQMDQYYDEKLSSLVIMVDDSQTRAAAEFHIDGIYKTTSPGLPPATNQQYKLRVGCFFELRDKKICRVTNYYNVPDWLVQVE